MRVLQVITGLAAGGAETQLRLLLRDSRHEHEVVCLYNPGSVAEQLRADGIAVTDLGMRTNTQVGAVFRLARLIRRGHYDVVHTHLYRACVYGRTAARLAGLRAVVATEHSLLDDQLEGRRVTRGVRVLYGATERLGRRTIAVSAAVRDNLLRWGIPPERVVVVPNGLDLPALAFDPRARAAVRGALGIPDDADVVGAVGRLHPGKQFDELLTPPLPGLGPRRQLLVVGEGPERARLAALARDAGVSEFVHLVGEQPVGRHLSAMDVLASPSRYETFGLAVVEALASGLPVVYRRCPALAELGVRVPGAHQASRDAGSLAALVDTALRERPERVCPPQLRPLSMTRIAAAVDTVYDQLVESPARGR
jgi:glycosyltransferase involved in cell wall biosynthesis